MERGYVPSAHANMNVGTLFQDVNISDLMKKLDILGDNGVTMSSRSPVRVLALVRVYCVASVLSCLTFLLI